MRSGPGPNSIVFVILAMFPGMREAAVPDDERALAHDDDGDVLWQESLAFFWFDERTGVGGAHRVAHEPVRGLANRHSGLLTRAGTRYRAADGALALGPEDRQVNRMTAGTQAVSLDGDDVILELRDADAACTLRFTDGYPMSPYPGAPASVAETAPRHYEASGTVQGDVQVGDERFTVEGLAHRDHSWGQRRWDWVLSHRWVAGVVGDGIGFSLFAVHDREGGFASGGFVVAGGDVLPATDVDIVVHLEADGVSHRGGTVTASTPDGTIRLDCTTVDGFVWGHRELAYTDALCTVRSDRGNGFCCFEVANNPHAGAAAANLALGACLTSGLSHR